MESWKQEMIENNFLAHHGILGQKWGIRRYQNPDGSLTAEGKKHYARLSEDSKNFATTVANADREHKIIRSYVGPTKDGVKYIVPHDVKQRFDDAVKAVSKAEEIIKRKYKDYFVDRKTMDDGHDYVITYIKDPISDNYYQYFALVN